MEVVGVVEVLDKGWAPVMGVEVRIRNQLASRKWRHVLRQDGELINIRSQPSSGVDCPPLRLTRAVGGDVWGALLGHIGSRAPSVRLLRVLGIRRWPLPIDILYYDRRCFPNSARSHGYYALASYACLSREPASVEGGQ
jgi:hypothetical protein